MNHSFQLTYRSEDLREIYKDSLRYRLLVERNYSALFLGTSFVLLALLFLLRPMSKDVFVVLAIGFGVGIVFQGYRLLRDYRRYLAQKKEIEKWIKQIEVYNSHKILDVEDAFHYLRDEEVFVYAFERIEESYVGEHYFHCVESDQGDIILPRKAFQDGDYETFVEIMNERLK